MDNQYQQPNEQQPPAFQGQPLNQQPYQQPPYQQPSYYQPNYAQGQRPPKPDSNLVWAILTTIFCCMPLGIVSIVYAAKVDGLYNAGDYINAQQASNDAKKWAMWSAITCAIGVILYILVIVVFAIAAEMK